LTARASATRPRPTPSIQTSSLTASPCGGRSPRLVGSAGPVRWGNVDDRDLRSGRRRHGRGDCRRCRDRHRRGRRRRPADRCANNAACGGEEAGPERSGPCDNTSRNERLPGLVQGEEPLRTRFMCPSGLSRSSRDDVDGQHPLPSDLHGGGVSISRSR
jgi:hypothetical protein